MRRWRLPEEPGEVLCDPPFSEWAALCQRNARSLAQSELTIAGVPAVELRRAARRDLDCAAAPFVVQTGHQPDLWHCGVWIKPFLVDRLATTLDAAAVCLQVDSDEATPIEVRWPVTEPSFAVATRPLALPTTGTIWSATPPPAAPFVTAACTAIAAALAANPSTDAGRWFGQWAQGLHAALPAATSLGDLLTRARRRHERSVATRCTDVSVTASARREPFLAFAADLALDATAFVEAYNGALAAYRRQAGLRNAAQPLPDLRRSDARVELPLWWIEAGRRAVVWAQPTKDGVELIVADRPVLVLPRDPARAIQTLIEEASLAPRGLTLTLFHRLFCADLFVHGLGGARYDQVTDELMRAYYRIAPPPFVVATTTLHLDASIPAAGAGELQQLEQERARFLRRPDRVALARGASLSPEAERLATEADQLRATLAEGHDASHRTALAALTTRLREILGAVDRSLELELEEARARFAAGRVLRDRTYPLCFFDPAQLRALAWSA